MKAKRSKQYRKLMQQYGLHFGFREPYQVLLDARVLLDAARFKMDFVAMLSRTLHGEIKPMITQCSMRHLYASNPKSELVIEHAKRFERRRCNHHILEDPLSELDCFSSVVDPKGSRTNKHRYIVASQDLKVRSLMRSIPGIPLIYLKRSVMIMEPMAGATEEVRNREEEVKFQAGLKGQRLVGQELKRKQPEHSAQDFDNQSSGSAKEVEADIVEATTVEPPRKRKKRVPSAPNPLSVKKPKVRPETAKQNSDNKTIKQRKRKRRSRPTTKSTAPQSTALTFSETGT